MRKLMGEMFDFELLSKTDCTVDIKVSTNTGGEYLTCRFKWDGCADIWTDGIHLCEGLDGVEDICTMLRDLYAFAAKHIEIEC